MAVIRLSCHIMIGSSREAGLGSVVWQGSVLRAGPVRDAVTMQRPDPVCDRVS